MGRRIPRGLWLPLSVLGIVAFGWLSRGWHIGQWMDSLPLAYQVLAKSTFVLAPIVGMFLVWLAVFRMRKDA